MDLAQIEGLGDLIEAETEAQRRQALRAMNGGLREKVELWRRDLVRAMSLIEATIDFVDEDVPVDVMPEVSVLLGSVLASLKSEADGVRAAERLADGFRVAIVGAPNVGKSTLLNHIAGRDVAIVTDVAGTTRDVLEVHTQLKGLPVTFLDTAGFRETSDQVEQIGVSRARVAAMEADIRIYLAEGVDKVDLDVGDDDLILVPKDDDGSFGGISGATGHGVDSALDHVAKVLSERVSGVGVAMKERHLSALRLAVEWLENAQSGFLNPAGLPELISDDIRSAVRAIESLIGRVDVEDLLDEIFASFCIGK